MGAVRFGAVSSETATETEIFYGAVGFWSQAPNETKPFGSVRCGFKQFRFGFWEKNAIFFQPFLGQFNYAILLSN